MPIEQDATDEVENVETEDDISAFLVSDDDEEQEPEAVEGEDAETAEDDTDEDAEAVEEDETDDDEDEEDDEEPQLFEVTVDRDENGDPIKDTVTADELVAGYQRQRDYTQKTQALSEQRRQIEQQEQVIQQGRERLMQELTQWAVPQEQEPDWAAAAQQLAPQQFNLLRVQWEQKQRQSQAAQQRYQQLQQEIQAEQQAEFAQRRNDSLKRLTETYPEWKDKQKAAEAVQKITATAKEVYGFTDEELGSIADDRMVRVLWEAARYREIEANNASMEKRVFKPGKTLRSGSKVTAKQKSKQKQTDAMKRLKGGDEDAFIDLLISGN